MILNINRIDSCEFDLCPSVNRVTCDSASVLNFASYQLCVEKSDNYTKIVCVGSSGQYSEQRAHSLRASGPERDVADLSQVAL